MDNDQESGNRRQIQIVFQCRYRLHRPARSTRESTTRPRVRTRGSKEIEVSEVEAKAREQDLEVDRGIETSKLT
jgi:hypothetical protein